MVNVPGKAGKKSINFTGIRVARWLEPVIKERYLPFKVEARTVIFLETSRLLYPASPLPPKGSRPISCLELLSRDTNPLYKWDPSRGTHIFLQLLTKDRSYGDPGEC